MVLSCLLPPSQHSVCLVILGAEPGMARIYHVKLRGSRFKGEPNAQRVKDSLMFDET